MSTIVTIKSADLSQLTYDIVDLLRNRPSDVDLDAAMRSVGVAVGMIYTLEMVGKPSNPVKQLHETLIASIPVGSQLLATAVNNQIVESHGGLQ